jgi:hypothetical protein
LLALDEGFDDPRLDTLFSVVMTAIWRLSEPRSAFERSSEPQMRQALSAGRYGR